MKKIKISLLIAVLSMSLGVFSVHAAAGDVTWTSNTAVDLSAPDVDVTIIAGSTAESIVVNTGTIVPTLALGDVFRASTVPSGDFSVSPNNGVSVGCNSSGIATVVITADSTRAYTITPSTVACVVQGTGSYSVDGGGGGGTAAAAPATATPATPAVPTISPAIPATPASPTLGSASPKAYAFGTVLVRLGTKGGACKAWQMFLNDHSNAKLKTDGICGRLSIAAAKVWQKAKGLKADGLLGAMSRAKAKVQSGQQ